MSTNLPSGIEYWLGGYQDPYSETVATANWKWVTNEAWVYTNWLNGEPNDFNGAGREQYLSMNARANWPGMTGMWNDGGTDSVYLAGNISGYIAEKSVPESTAMLLLVLGLVGLAGLSRRLCN